MSGVRSAPALSPASGFLNTAAVAPRRNGGLARAPYSVLISSMITTVLRISIASSSFRSSPVRALTELIHAFATLSRCHFLESTQRLDLIFEFRQPVHGIEHHHVGAELAPAIGRCRPTLRVGVVHPQPPLKPEFAGITSLLVHFLAAQ